jgi:hypothetical protein
MPGSRNELTLAIIFQMEAGSLDPPITQSQPASTSAFHEPGVPDVPGVPGVPELFGP